MGLFCCCFKPKVFNSERKHLLENQKGRNDVLSGHPSEIIPSINTLFSAQIIDLSEQTLFEITVQQMAAKMVNIPALNNQVSEPDWKSRQKIYENSVQRIKSPLRLKSEAQKESEKSKAKGETSHHKHLTVYEKCSKIETISGEDLKLIDKYSEKSSIAVSKGFNFWTDEPFVVEFDYNLN